MIWLNRGLALLLLVIGGALVWLGVQLALAGGSLYYLPAGMALIATSLLLWRESRRARTSPFHSCAGKLRSHGHISRQR